MPDKDIFTRLLPAILNDPAMAGEYNPIYCYGSRAALSRAEEWADGLIVREHPERVVCRIAGSAYVRGMIGRIMNDQDLSEYRKGFCRGDLLVLTEPEAFAGRSQSSEDLYYILDDCLLRARPILVFGGSPPCAIPRLEPRVRTQLEGGIILDMNEDSFSA